ncbi:MAG: DNA-binding protein [Candidatus Thermoplasmatota archaeon]|nr:DNA-binding protein [Candidatus Thermoplasmatota archaeon]
MDKELENIRKKRAQELQQQQALQESMLEEQEKQQQDFEKQKKQILRAILTNDARERLGRIKVARPEIAENIENQLILATQQGQLQSKINDEQLRMLLKKIMPKKRDITIKRR